jgi:hypothetical protein
MIANWILVTIIAVVTSLILRNSLSGIEWFGSPLLVCVLLGIIMTVLYFTTRTRDWKITEIILFWFAALFILITINMATLASLILGAWEDFQAMPIMGTFQLLLTAIAVHFHVVHMRKTPLNIFTLWTTVLFAWVLTSMVFLALSLFGGFDTGFQQYPLIGFGLWTTLMFILYLVPHPEKLTTKIVFFFWSWFLFLGIGTSMLLTYFFALTPTENQLWPLFPALGALALAIFSTILLFVNRKTRVVPSEKVSTFNDS